MPRGPERARASPTVGAGARPGEIIGIAGVVGNGQTELLRALAGLEAFTGTVEVGGRPARARPTCSSCGAYMPADRHAEGLAMSLIGPRERRALGAARPSGSGPAAVPHPRGRRRPRLARLAVGQGAVARRAGRRPLGRQPAEGRHLPRAALRPGRCWWPTSPPRASTSAPAPRSTAILREASARGVPVVVASSDAKELEGLCDQVLVMSRGHVVATLVGDEVTEERIVSAAVTSTAEAPSAAAARRDSQHPAAPVPPGRLRADRAAAAGHRAASRSIIAPGNERYLSRVQHRQRPAAARPRSA